MDNDTISPTESEHSSGQRRPWETPLLQEIRIDEGTDGKPVFATEFSSKLGLAAS